MERTIVESAKDGIGDVADARLQGRRDAGRRPPFTSYARNSKRFSAISAI